MVAFACYDLCLSGQLLARCVLARLFAGETFACKDVFLNNGYTTSKQNFMYSLISNIGPNLFSDRLLSKHYIRCSLHNT